MNQIKKASAVGLILSLLVVSFQNCSPKNFSAAPVPNSSTNASSSSDSEPREPAAPLSPSQPPTPIIPAATTFNFVSVNENDCDLATADFIRTKLNSDVLVVTSPKCRIGGGCGVSCGKPDGVNCLSANPTSFGACVDKADIDSHVLSNMQIFNSPNNTFNFATNDVSSCNSSVLSRYRIATGKTLSSVNVCSLSGGCGVSCGKPNGTSCLSANPSLQGSCIGYSELRNLSANSQPNPNTGLSHGATTTISLQTSFGLIDLTCNAYQEGSVPGGFFIRCRGDVTSSAKTSFGASYSLPKTATVWGKTLTMNFFDFRTDNYDQQAYYDANCSQPKDYFMGSSRTFTTNTGTIPRCKLTDSGETGQCVDTTECKYAPILGGLYYRTKNVGWSSVTITYENIQR